MQTGDSMLVPDWNQARAAYLWADRNGRAFIARSEKTPPHGVRIWRIG
jgi:hypothetical protein